MRVINQVNKFGRVGFKDNLGIFLIQSQLGASKHRPCLGEERISLANVMNESEMPLAVMISNDSSSSYYTCILIPSSINVNLYLVPWWLLPTHTAFNNSRDSAKEGWRPALFAIFNEHFNRFEFVKCWSWNTWQFLHFHIHQLATQKTRFQWYSHTS